MARSCLRLALPIAVVVAAAGTAAADQLHHLPPAEAEPDAPLTLTATVDRGWESTVELRYRPVGAARVLRDHLLIYGLGGIVAPFIGIKIIDMILVALHLV